MAAEAYLSHIEYGKGEVRVTKVKKDAPTEGQSQLLEIKAQVTLQGDFVPSFVHGDNALVVPTDTCKNIIYYLAKDNLNEDLEAFGVVVARYFLREYGHVSVVNVQLEQVSWSRLVVDGVPHAHSFEQQRMKRLASVVASRERLHVTGGLCDLRVLKTTGSGFSDFHRCKLTTLQDVDDRILSTDVSATWTFDPRAASEGAIAYTAVFDAVRSAIIAIFCNTYSVSVQATMWEMGKHVIDSHHTVNDIALYLPNIHNWHYDLARFGQENNVKSRSQIFYPTDQPRGVIKCTVSRQHLSSRL